MRVLLTRLSALGDIVHTWPLAEALRASRPDLELLWLVERPFVSLVETHPAVSQVITVATRRWRRSPLASATRREVCSAVVGLRALRPELVLDPQGLVKSAIWGLLAGAPERVGLSRGVRRERLAGACYTRTVTPEAGTRHVIDINLSLASALGVSAPEGARPDGRFLLATGPPVPAPEPGSVLLLPATGGVGKAWGGHAYAALAQRLAASGRPVVVAWGPGEEDLARNIVSAGGGDVTMAPPTTILQLASLISQCAAVVGGDTGTVHLAASLGIPTVAVFLRTDPERNGPRGSAVRVLTAAAGRARRGRARTALRGSVSVEQVLSAVMDLQ